MQKTLGVLPGKCTLQGLEVHGEKNHFAGRRIGVKDFAESRGRFWGTTKEYGETRNQRQEVLAL